MADEILCAVPGCDKRRDSYKKYCSAHYQKKRKYGDPLGSAPPAPPPATLQWLLDRVDYSGDDCLFWPFSSKSNGYGQLYKRGRKGPIAATRYMAELVYGEAPDPKMHAAHACGNGHLGCCTPRHLRWATPSENSYDKVLHGTILRGAKAPRAKLNNDSVMEIVRLCSTMRNFEIAKMFGVAPKTIGDIRYGKQWSWLTGIERNGRDSDR